MLKLSVCTDAVFGGIKTREAMDIVHACGIKAVEFWDWWSKDLDAVGQKRRELGMTVCALCTRFISLTDPSCREAYMEGLKETITVAKGLDCNLIISQVGADTKAPREFQQKSIVEGLKACSSILEDAGMTLVIEPLNTRVDHEGYYLSSSDEASEIIKAVGSSSIRMLFDCYHQQISEGDLIRRLGVHMEQIGHIHIAGNPGRHEPERGEINYSAVLEALKEASYSGYIGFEYFPERDVKETLTHWQSIVS